MEFYSKIKRKYNVIIGWGIGGVAESFVSKDIIDFKYLVDSRNTMSGKKIYHIDIKDNSSLLQEDFTTTLIIVLSSFYDEIKEIIKEFGDFDVVSYEIFSNDYYNKNIMQYINMDKKIVITISNNDYTLISAGTEKVIKEQNKYLTENDVDTFHIYSLEKIVKFKDDTILGVVYNNTDHLIISYTDFQKFLCAIDKSILSVIIHNLIGYSQFIRNKIITWFCNKKVFCYMHDYSWICTSFNLMYNNIEYCKLELHNFEKCDMCINNHTNIALRNDTMKIFKSDNVKIICPSIDVKSRIELFYNGSNDDKGKFLVLAHQKYLVSMNYSSRINKKLKIAYVGYKSYIKGWETFKKIVKQYRNYDFYVLGVADEKLDNVKYIDVSFQKNGINDMVNKLKENNIDIAFLWSIWPETYSYTYFESSSAGLFVITNILSGNIAYQVEKNKNGIILKDEENLNLLLDNECYLKQLLASNKYKIEELSLNTDFYNLIEKI